MQMCTRIVCNSLRAIVLIASMGMWSSNFVFAQPMSMNPDDPKAVEIVWTSEAKLGDHVGRIEGAVDQVGKRFYLDGLNVMSPLVIKVFAKDESKPIDISLHRYIWKKPDLAGVTDAEGNWGYVGRVHDEVGIQLKANEPSEFYILAWQGDEAKMDFGRTVFMPVENAGGKDAGESTGIPMWIIVVVVVLALLVAYLLGKVKSAKSAGLVFIFLASGLSTVDVWAEAIESRLASAETDISEIRRILREVEDKGRDSSERLEARVGALEDRPDTSTENSNRIRRLDSLYRQLSNDHRQLATDRVETNSIIATQLNTMRGQIAALQTLVAEDRAAVPDPGHGGVSPVPSGCVDNPDCSRCSREVNERLSARLENYEKLRVIYASYNQMYSYAVDFGNSLSGWHQLEQAVWYTEKVKMVKYQQDLSQVYTAKLEEFNADLRSILYDFGQCEEQYGMGDWFNRYGVLYYQSLISGYRLD